MSEIQHMMVMVIMIIFLTTVPASIVISLYIKVSERFDKKKL